MDKKSVAVVNSKSFGKLTEAYQELERYFNVRFLSVPNDIDGKSLADVLTDYDFLIISSTPYYSSDFFQHNQRVLAIVRHGIGVDNVDIKKATENGVLVFRIPGVFERESVAEHTIALILNALRRITEANESLKQGRWENRVNLIGSELSKKTVGVIGFGNIGCRVTEILVKGFGAKVIVYDPYVSGELIREYGAEPKEFESVIREADIITLHCPLNEDTKYLINRNVMEKMKDGVIVVNTARGKLIETQALIEKLKEEKIAYASLDVMEEEPLPLDHPLLKLKNVILTPHIAAYTVESLKGMDEYIVESLKKLVNGIIPDGLANPDVLKGSPRLTKIH